MVTFRDALKMVMDCARRLDTERIEIRPALNRVLAEDVTSDTDIPPFDKSAMDGYACKKEDLGGELAIIEIIPAGKKPQKTIKPGRCAKIMTGGMVPEGADCVIMKEFVEKSNVNTIRFTGDKTATNICLRGEDIKQGECVLQQGTLIKARHIAILASAGCVKPLVSKKPKVGIIATGNELVEPSEKPDPSHIRNSNSFQLTAQAEQAGAAGSNYGIARDTIEELNSTLKKAIKQNDVVLISGGVSVGDYDLVKDILRENNIKILFEKVAIKPGRPTVFGTGENIFCFGLPGNPVSSFVTFELMVKPFLYKMMGHKYRQPILYAKLHKTITRSKIERDSWLPVIFTEQGQIETIEYHGSAHIHSLCQADGLICIPAGAKEITEGTEIAVRQI